VASVYENTLAMAGMRTPLRKPQTEVTKYPKQKNGVQRPGRLVAMNVSVIQLGDQGFDAYNGWG
jgi:hypothetical protein